MRLDTLRLSAERLLETFATGGLTPGAGSAGALTAALSAALICALADPGTRAAAERAATEARAAEIPRRVVELSGTLLPDEA